MFVQIKTLPGGVVSIHAEASARKLRFDAAAFDFAEVVSQPLQDFIVLAVAHFSLDLGEREVNDVVMVNLLARKAVAEIKPNLVEEVDLLRRQTRRMGSEIENLLLAGGSKDFQGDLRARLGHFFPCRAD